MKRVLIISYYWPPSGGSGVQRWLKFTKYLPEYGVIPIVYTPENPENPEIDLSLIESISPETIVIKKKIWEPYSIYKFISGKKQNTKLSASFAKTKKGNSLIERLSIWIRGNFLIPDPRVFWVKSSVRFLENYLKQNPVDVIISTGPPHSMHMIALRLKEKLGLTWIADFRDPWTQIDFYQELLLSRWGDSKHRKLERQVLESADKLVVVGEGMKSDFLDLNDTISPDKITVIHNGYDESDFANSSVSEALDDKFSIVHIGTLGAARNPNALWQSIAELIKEDQNFATHLVLRFVGKTDYSVNESLNALDLLNYAEFIDYVPHHEVVKYQQSARVLLLLINNTPNAKSILTGKFFEYMVSGRPVFAVGIEDSEIDKIIQSTECGVLCGFKEVNKMKAELKKCFELYLLKNDLHFGNANVKAFTRKSLTQKLVDIL